MPTLVYVCGRFKSTDSTAAYVFVIISETKIVRKQKKSTSPDELTFLSTLEKDQFQWSPPSGESKALDLYLKNIHHEVQQLKHKWLAQSNLFLGEWRALKSLKNRTDMIKPADEVGAVVV